MRRCARPIVFAIIAALGAWAAWGQNLDEGKTAPQLFEADCSACHKGPQGLGKNASVGFLRQHYTSSAQSASLLAAYLAAAGNNPRGERKRVGTGDEKAGPAEERENRANRKNREKTAVAHPEEKEKTAAERRKERKSKRPGPPEPAASQPPPAPASPPPTTATAPAPASGEGQTAAAPPPASPPSGEVPAPSTAATTPPSPQDTPAVAATPAANPPPASTPSPSPSPSPSRVADQPVFSTPLP